jgi:hypothetical protein
MGGLVYKNLAMPSLETVILHKIRTYSSGLTYFFRFTDN